MSALIKDDRIVTASDDYVGDVFVVSDRSALLGQALDVEADKVIDASGKLVISGGIDPHTHLEMRFGGIVTCDDFTSGTIAARPRGNVVGASDTVLVRGHVIVENDELVAQPGAGRYVKRNRFGEGPVPALQPASTVPDV